MYRVYNVKLLKAGIANQIFWNREDAEMGKKYSFAKISKMLSSARLIRCLTAPPR